MRRANRYLKGATSDSHVSICSCARNQETAQKYDVFQMPTFLFMKKGEVVEQFSGADIGVLRQKIDGLL